LLVCQKKERIPHNLQAKQTSKRKFLDMHQLSMEGIEALAKEIEQMKKEK
jgi:hypothetical protein